MGGTFWYHPHHHGATAIQAGGGASGMIIVTDAPHQLPPVVASLEEIHLVIVSMNMPYLQTVSVEYEQNCRCANGACNACGSAVKTQNCRSTCGSMEGVEPRSQHVCPTDPDTDLATACKDHVWAPGPIAGNATNTLLVNGQSVPTISLKANQWYRFRTVFTAVEAIAAPRFDGCDAHILAKDG